MGAVSALHSGRRVLGASEKMNEIDKTNPTGRFVVHEHHSSRLHWDFRLEMDGVLKSWAVPKGIPEEEGVRRLAVQVEDHDLEHLDFEGEIPEGQYGAGTVRIWDSGVYYLESRKPQKIVFTLAGARLKGDYVLVHTKQDMWLIFKRKEKKRE